MNTLSPTASHKSNVASSVKIKNNIIATRCATANSDLKRLGALKVYHRKTNEMAGGIVGFIEKNEQIVPIIEIVQHSGIIIRKMSNACVVMAQITRWRSFLSDSAT